MTVGASERRVAEIAATVKRQFGDESGVQITDQDIIRWVDDAQRRIASSLKVIKGRAETVAIPGQKDYSIPAINAQQIESIHFDGRKVEGTTLAQMEETIIKSDPKNLSGGAPEFWYSWGAVVTFWPVPQEEKAITIFYAGVPAPLTSLTDFLGIPDRHYDTVVAYVMSKAYELDEEFEQSNNQRNIFNSDIMEVNDHEIEGQQLTYGSITMVDDDYHY